MTRKAFSLLEIIIATAVLAASAMVLSSLIGLGSKFGNRAEERTRAVSQAESLLDEFLANLSNEDEQLEENTGELPGPPSRGFRISTIPFPIGLANSNRLGESPNEPGSGLLQVTVEVFETSGSSLSSTAKPLVELSRLIRQPHKALNTVSSAAPQTTAQEVDSPLQGVFP
jgi:prepilin-type N-terminal cleavage/methylation domain-containing protein